MLHRLHIIIFSLLLSSYLLGQSELSIRDFVIEGNVKTKDWLIIRESGYSIGDSFSEEASEVVMATLKQNIANLQLFVTVDIVLIPLTGNEVLVNVKVEERWYFYPIPYIKLAEPNFNTWWRNRKESRTDYGLTLRFYNFRGRDEQLHFTFQTGFSREIGVKFISPYLVPRTKWGAQAFARYREFGEINVATLNNERVFIQGPDSKTRKQQQVGLGTTFRPDIFTENLFNISYQNVQVSDEVLEQPVIHLEDNSNRMRYFTLSYQFDYVNVDRRGYPLEGEHVTFTAEKIGMGIMNDSPDAFTSSAAFRLYRPLSGRLFFQTLVKGQATFFEELPYFLQDGLGYGNNSVRSYEYYIMDGQYYVYSRNNLKFTLFPESNFKLFARGETPLSRLSLGFHLNLIADVGYTGDRLYFEQNSLNNSLLLGTGLGLDVVTNYDIVLRLEYTVNKLGESGFFLHYNKAI